MSVIYIRPKELVDKYDGKKVYLYEGGNWFSSVYTSECGADFLIQVYNFHKNKDRRPVLARFVHFPQGLGKGPSSSHAIDICFDLKNHKSNQPFHLNCAWYARDTGCSICRKYLALEYSKGGLNHMPLSDQKGAANAFYKIITPDILWKELEDQLNKNGFFSEFNALRYTTRR